MSILLRSVILFAICNVFPVWFHAAASGTSAAPVVIGGDQATRIALSTPDATVQIVAGTEGIYLREAGQDWTKTGDAPDPGMIVFSASDPDVILVGDHQPCLRGGETTGLSRSEDGGTTWSVVDGASDLRPLAIWSDSGLALGATCSGFILSTDNGLTWSPVDAAEPGYEITAFTVVRDPVSVKGPVVLFGETSEGGSSRLRKLDLSDPPAPVASEGLRDYFASAGLAASGDTYALATIDGVWISRDAGTTWGRSAQGLGDVVLERNPADAGLPADLDINQYGLFAIVFLPDTKEGMAVGSSHGVYITTTLEGSWIPVTGAEEQVDQVSVSSGDNRLLFSAMDTVYETMIAGSSGSSKSRLARPQSGIY